MSLPFFAVMDNVKTGEGTGLTTVFGQHMNNLKQLIMLASLVGLTVLLSGCLEPPQIIKFEPGVYKGADDPLIGNTDTAALESRFANQMDR